MSNERSDISAEIEASPKQDGNGECFVIAPIGSDGSPTRERTEDLLDHVITPVVEDEFSLDVTVAHKIDRPGNITRQVMELLFEAELVIADLTEHNPNVMYELAVRHATGEPVVTIAEEGTKPPFDIGPQRTTFYKNTLGGVQDFKPKLRSAVEAALDDEHEPDNPIYRIQEDFQMREAVSGDSEMEYLMDRIDDIENAIKGDQGDKQENTQQPTPNYPLEKMRGRSTKPSTVTEKYELKGKEKAIESALSTLADYLDERGHKTRLEVVSRSDRKRDIKIEYYNDNKKNVESLLSNINSNFDVEVTPIVFSG